MKWLRRFWIPALDDEREQRTRQLEKATAKVVHRTDRLLQREMEIAMRELVGERRRHDHGHQPERRSK